MREPVLPAIDLGAPEAGGRSAFVPGVRGRSRQRMREFQANLTARLRDARSGDSGAGRLAVRVVDCDCLLHLPEAGEILPVPIITSVPLTQAWFLGIASVRGRIVSVIDLGRYMERGATRVDKDSRLILLGESLGFNAGLVVSAVLGLRSIKDMTPESSEPTAERPDWMEAPCIEPDGHRWLPLELGRLTREARFLHAGV